MTTGPTPRYTARFALILTPRMLEQVREVADAQKTTTAQWVRDAIRAALAHHKGDAP